MRSRLQWSKDARTGDLQFSGTVAMTDFENLRLSRFDEAVLADCGGPTTTAADFLLGLELVFRRLMEQAKEAA